MDSVSVNQFRDKLKNFVENVVNRHAPLRVTMRSGASFVIMSEDDWKREQETLYVLQNSILMNQHPDSLESHKTESGYKPIAEEVNESSRI